MFPDALMLGVRVENRSWPKQQCFAPIRKIRDVGSETNNALFKAGGGKQTYRIVGRRIFDASAPSHRLRDDSLDLLNVSRQTYLQFCPRSVCYYIWTRASGNHTDIAGCLTKKAIVGPGTIANTLEHIEQLLHC